MRDRPQRLKRLIRSRLLRHWIIACILGGVVLLIVLNAGQVLQIIVPNLNLRTPFLLIGGAALGFCQWLALRHHFQRSYWWIATTALGVWLSGFLQSIAAPLLQPLRAIPAPLRAQQILMTWLLVSVLISFLMVSIAQFVFFTTRVNGAWRWIAGMVLAGLVFLSVVAALLFTFGPIARLSNAIAFVLVFLSYLIGAIAASALLGVLLLAFVRQKNN